MQIALGLESFTVSFDNVSSMWLVRECRELEEHFGTFVTNSILHWLQTSIRAVKIRLRKIDREIMLRRCTEKAPSVTNIERGVGWTKLWNAAFNLGAKRSRELQAFSRVLSHNGRGVKPCPLCNVPGPLHCLLDHLLKEHLGNLKFGDDLLMIESLLSLVVDCNVASVAKF